MKAKSNNKFFVYRLSLFLYIIFLLFPIIAATQIKSARAQSYTDVSVQTAYEMINNHTQYPNLIILDVREQFEYDESHIHNATLIPRGEIDARISELNSYKDTEILVYCRTGGRSAMASQNLADNHNFTKIFNMLGGITDWIDAGYPVWTIGAVPGDNSIGFSFTFFTITLMGLVLTLLIFLRRKHFKKIISYSE
ncbi:MAG: rhodanese-like domain-containing protein [Promethearchaeota archaeon]